MFIDRAAATLVGIVRETKPDQLTAPTPCAEYDVRDLVRHLLFWGPSLAGAGHKEFVPPPAATEAEIEPPGDDWADRLVALVERIAAAWRAPDALTGTTRMGGPMELPADLVGGMVLGELVVHGWDLARATGQRPEWDEDLLRHTLAETARSAEQGRAMGIYAAEVAVPASASTLDRLVAVTGRDPKWTPEER